MSRPRGWGAHELVLLATLVLLILRPAAAVEIRSGNLLITDRNANPFSTGDFRGSLFLGDPGGPVRVRLLATPVGFVDPVATAPMEDARVLVVDANADIDGLGQNRGAVWLIDPNDPLPGKATLFAWSRSWVDPVDILLEPSGDVLLLDSDADPTQLGTRPGALYRIDGTTRIAAPFATSPLWVEPRSMVYDLDGSILVWDYRADPLGTGLVPGALFRVDATTGEVTVVFSQPAFVTPYAICLDSNGDYLILDRDANPNGHEGAPGAIYRVRRSDLSVQAAFAPPDFVEPYDMLRDPSGRIWVLDEQANPLQIPNASGALFQCDLSTGTITQTIGSGFFRSLSGISQFQGTALDSSLVRWEDENGAPLQPGDRMRVRVRVRNTGQTAGRPVTLEHRLSEAWDFRIGSDSVSAGAFSYIPATRSIVWSGDVEVQGEVDIAYDLRLRNDVAEGSGISERIVLRVQRAASTFDLNADVARRSEVGRIVWADYQNVGGTSVGRILEPPGEGPRPQVVFEGPPLEQPSDVAFLSDGTIAILDRRGVTGGPGSPLGGIFRLDPLTGEIETLLAFADHPELSVPLGIANGRADELLLVDKDANPRGFAGRPGAVFALDLKSGALDLVASDSRFSEPSDVVSEDDGTLLLIDYDADPSGSNPRDGALFTIDRASGSVEPVPLPGGSFVDPIGITVSPGGRIFIADLTADPLGLGTNTGAIFEVRRANATIQVAAADSVLVDPTDVAFTRDGRLIITDRDGNPFHLPPGDHGAVYSARPYIPGVSIVSAHSSLDGPEAVAIFEEGNLALSSLSIVEGGEPPVLSGDTLRFRATVRNMGRAVVPEALATVLLSGDLQLLDAEGPEGTEMDATLGAVSWLGPVPLGRSVEIDLEARVRPGLDFGDPVFGVLRISGPHSPNPDSAGARVVAPLGSGDLVVVDMNADEIGDGRNRGALFFVDAVQKQFESLLLADSSWVDPLAIEPIEPIEEGRFLLADPMGGAPAVIRTVDYLRATSETTIADPRLGYPTDLLRTRAGDLLITDPLATLHPGDSPGPVIFVQRGGSGPLEVFSQNPAFRHPAQIAEDESGRLWCADRLADPDGDPQTGRGALFQIDPQSGAVLDTLQFPEMQSPASVVPWTDNGLVLIDEASDAGGEGRGAVFLIDPDQRSLSLLLSDPRFRQLRNGAFSSSGELWIVDRLARDETKPGQPRTLFRWDPETDQLEAVAADPSLATPMEIYSFPGPNPRLRSYTFEDLDGPPLEGDDEVQVTAEIANIGPVETLAAVYSDTLPPSINLDPGSIQTPGGTVSLPTGLNGLVWTVDLEQGDQLQIHYGGRMRQTLQQGGVLNLRSHLRTSEGVHRMRKLTARLPVYYQEGFLYLADGDADPYELGNTPGALWKIHLSSGQTTAMGSDSQLVQPVATIALPSEPPTILMVDSEANPGGHPEAKGAIFRWIPETSGFELLVADSLFRSPRSAVAVDDHTILLLDAQADPNHLTAASGPGAIFRVDLATKRVETVVSDTAFASPRAIVRQDENHVFVIDADADPLAFRLRNGAVFRVDLATRQVQTYAASADFRGPIGGAIGPEGDLYVVDRDVVPIPDDGSRGAIFRLDSKGNVVSVLKSRKLRRPHSIAFDQVGRMVISDSDADANHTGGSPGAVFRKETFSDDLQLLAGLSRFRAPSGFFLYEPLTPIDLTAFEALAGDAGVLLTWQVGEAAFEGYVLERAEGLDPADGEYVALNPDRPVPREGPFEYLDETAEPEVLYSYRIEALLPDGGTMLYGPVTATARTLRFSLLPPAPHPFRGASTSLRFDIPKAGKVELAVFDATGRRVRTLRDETMQAGRHSEVWDGRNDRGHPVASGVYLLHLRWQDREATRRLIRLR
ncbi:MAG: FlgD immunoglobulin-like domain containing protein [Candidatus Eisenbacteria bacterium]